MGDCEDCKRIRHESGDGGATCGPCVEAICNTYNQFIDELKAGRAAIQPPEKGR